MAELIPSHNVAQMTLPNYKPLASKALSGKTTLTKNCGLMILSMTRFRVDSNGDLAVTSSPAEPFHLPIVKPSYTGTTHTIKVSQSADTLILE